MLGNNVFYDCKTNLDDVEYFPTHILVSAPEHLSGKLYKILSFPQMGHKHVIKGIQARATQTCAPVHPDHNKRDTCTSLKAHAH